MKVFQWCMFVQRGRNVLERGLVSPLIPSFSGTFHIIIPIVSPFTIYGECVNHLGKLRIPKSSKEHSYTAEVG